MREGRLKGFVAGLGLGYLHTATALVAALLLTPYLLGRLGAHDYGLWLIGAQVLAYLALMDVGIVALVPREVAFAVGQGRGADSPEVRALVSRTLGVVTWQVPFVVAAVAATWWWLPADWTLVRGPLGVALLGFALLFPLRVFVALLQGLQDLAYLGVAQLAGLVVGTVATAGAVWGGLGLYALAIGWVAGQIVPAAMAWRRLRHHHPHVWPREPISRSWPTVRGQLSRGVWISVSQVAQVLLTGTDVLVIGALLGPEAVVVYVCTGKLLSMLANQPQLLLQTALPALSELRGAAARERLDQIARSMTQLLFLASGAIVVSVLVVNQGFVTWWVGAPRFGGLALTAALTASMFARQVNFAAVYTLFCFGYERRLAVTSVADGLVGAVAMLVLVPLVGPIGAPVGLLLATVLISLPANLRGLGREMGTEPLAFLAFWSGWGVRFVVVLVCASLVATTIEGGVWWAAGLAAASTLVIYGVVMRPELARPPLGPMLAGRIGPWRLFGAPWGRPAGEHGVAP